MLAHTCNPSAYKAERGRSLGLTDQHYLTGTRLVLEKALCAHGMHWKLLSNLHMFTPMCICIYVYITYRWTQIHTHGYVWTHIHAHTHEYVCVCACTLSCTEAVTLQFNFKWIMNNHDILVIEGIPAGI